MLLKEPLEMPRVPRRDFGMTSAAWLSLGPARWEGLGLGGNSMAELAERMGSVGPAHTISILPSGKPPALPPRLCVKGITAW